MGFTSSLQHAIDSLYSAGSSAVDYVEDTVTQVVDTASDIYNLIKHVPDVVDNYELLSRYSASLLEDTKWMQDYYQLDYHIMSTEEAQQMISHSMLARYAYNSSSDKFGNLGSSSEYFGLTEEQVRDASAAFNIDLDFNFKTQRKATEYLVSKLNKAGFKDIIIDDEGAIVDKKSGLRCVILGDRLNKGTISLGFGGTTAGKETKMTFNQILADVYQFAGGIPTAYEEAAEIVRIISKMYPNSNIDVAGHSMGGGLTQYATLMNYDERIHGYCFDSAALGSSAQNNIGDNLQYANSAITHVGVVGDPVSDWSYDIFGSLDLAASAAGIKTPGNFGTRYFLAPDLDKEIQSMGDWMYATVLDPHSNFDQYLFNAAISGAAMAA